MDEDVNTVLITTHISSDVFNGIIGTIQPALPILTTCDRVVTLKGLRERASMLISQTLAHLSEDSPHTNHRPVHRIHCSQRHLPRVLEIDDYESWLPCCYPGVRQDSLPMYFTPRGGAGRLPDGRRAVPSPKIELLLYV